MSDPHALKALITSQIRTSGPMALDAFMQICLHHPRHGYYARGEGFGASGDFITAPEISPLFGQCIANWIVGEWQALGAPQAWRLVELGPGRGALMDTVLQALKRSPSELHLVEASSNLRALISERLEYVPEFFEDLGLLPQSNLPTIVIGNEYFDALPIRQFKGAKKEVFEICVGCDSANELEFQTRAAGMIGQAFELREGEYAEISLASQTQLKFLCSDLATTGGAALFIDYGYLRSEKKPTFQALKNHAPVHPLENPGRADLTAHVDFGALSELVRQLGLDPKLETQAALLKRLGLDTLLGLAPQEAAAVARLIRPEAMGELFKALSFRVPRA